MQERIYNKWIVHGPSSSQAADCRISYWAIVEYGQAESFRSKGKIISSIHMERDLLFPTRCMAAAVRLQALVGILKLH